MTAARTNFSFDNLIARFSYGLREASRWALKGMLAIAIIIFAGMFAVLTAIIGLGIAAVAILLRLTTGGRKETVFTSRKTNPDTEASGVTLDAHRTASGWTVE